MSRISSISAREILDSRGNPTIEVEMHLECGIRSIASVPSGASTGAHEAVELRDGDKDRYGGKGVLKAIRSITERISPALKGSPIGQQTQIDERMIELDGTKNKSLLGANAILGVSLAYAKATAAAERLPLFQSIGGDESCVLPVPLMNVINGGVHADNSLDFQEFMIAPVSANRFSEALRMGTEVFQALKAKLSEMGHSTNVGDEGGFAPRLTNAKEALGILEKAVSAAGYITGEDILFALDCAATEYFQNGIYSFAGEGAQRSAEQTNEYLSELTRTFPIISIEDGMAEDDWAGWQLVTQAIGNRCQLVGDDLFVTSQTRLAQGIQDGCGNSILIKLNQIGTLSETMDTIAMAKRAGFTTIISHRSGETEDTTISDLAVATNAGQIKTGSLSRSDRTAKYNQLLRIEETLGDRAVYRGRAEFSAFES